MSTSIQRILLVDNDESVLSATTFRLEGRGYTVLPVQSKRKALEALATELFHLAIIDLRLEDERFQRDLSGFEVARRLPDHVPFIIYTAYEDKENIKQALGELGALAIIDKTAPQASSNLLVAVTKAFTDVVGINADLQIESSPNLEVLARRIELPAELTPPTPTGADVETVLRRLFERASSVHLASLLAPEAASINSQSGAVLLQVQERRRDGTPMPVVLKLGLCADIRSEAENYRTIKPFLGGQRLAQLEGEAYSRQVGGLVYSLVGAQQWQTIRSLADVIRNEEPAQVVALLTRFFRQTFSPIYGDARLESIDLVEHYTTVLHLTVEKVEQSLAAFYPAALTLAPLQFAGIKAELFNPLTYALANGAFRHGDAISTYCCWSHGDLHSRNILVDEENQVWLIDFARATRSHALRDIVELETNIKYQVLPTDDLAAALAFECALLTPTQWTERYPSVSLPANLQRAYMIICALRGLAHELINPQQDMAEYYTALFWHTLNMVRLKRIDPPQRHHALLAAGVIAQRLHTWPVWESPTRPAKAKMRTRLVQFGGIMGGYLLVRLWLQEALPVSITLLDVAVFIVALVGAWFSEPLWSALRQLYPQR